MGLESFYVKLLPDDKHTIESAKIHRIFDDLQIYRKESNKYIYKSELIIEFCEDNGLKEIVLQGCFSNYEKHLEDMFLVAKNISEEIAIRIYHELGVNQKISNEKQFIHSIKRIYHDKHSQFLQTFGETTFNALPDSDFYKKLKWHNLRKAVQRLFKKK